MPLTQALHPMPDFVAGALDANGLRAACEARPPRQRDDDPGRSHTAKRQEMQGKRLLRTLSELSSSEDCKSIPRRPGA